MRRVLVHSAAIQDSAGADWWLATLWCDFPDLKLMWGEEGYKDWVIDDAKPSYAVTLEQGPPTGHGGGAGQPRRWVIERTFAWLGRGRRLSKDYQRVPENSESVG